MTDSKKAQLIKRIKEMRDQRMPFKEIGPIIFKEGFTTDSGGEIHIGSLSAILLKAHPEYRVRAKYNIKKKNVGISGIKNKSAREMAVDIIMKSEEMSVKDRLEVSLELMTRK